MDDNWRGKNKTPHYPWIAVADRDEVFFDRHGRPKGCEMKHFETRNFGWVAWKVPDGKSHLYNVG